MVTRDSDLTRLLGGLEKRGLVKRQRAADDARRMDNQVTAKGRALLKRLDEPVRHAVRSQFHGAGKKKLEGLAGLLEEVRRVAKEAGLFFDN